MPLTDQEIRCIDMACSHLAGLYGGIWRITAVPDEQYPSEPSPDAIVSNDVTTAAIEVKRLTGDAVLQTYKESMLSLNRFLVPSCGGHYTLNPYEDFRLPMEPPFKRHVKHEIERVAPSLAPGESGAIRMPRQAHISLANESGPGYIYCCHNVTGHFVQQVSPRLTGAFFLVDDGQWEHEFVTDEALAAFHDALVSACQTRVEQGKAPVSWVEEWELTRREEDGSGEAGVFLICVTDARSVYGSVAEAVDVMLEKAKRKFEARRWADHNVVVFDNASALTNTERVADVVAGFERDELGAIDLILFAHGDDLTQVWPTIAEPHDLHAGQRRRKKRGH